MVTVNKKIVSYSVVSQQSTNHGESSKMMTVNFSRPFSLTGTTYKIKTPFCDSAFYVTINYVELEDRLYPFELFVNSKSMEHFQWILALTRVISAVFRHGRDCAFLIDELKAIFDPKGGYFKAGGGYMPSLVAEIGAVLEQDFTLRGLLKRDTSLQEAAVSMLAEKTAKKSSERLSNAQACPKCQDLGMVVMDGCLTCTACGWSKCG